MVERKTIDLASARVLISNDDGIDAAGLAVLEESVRPLVGELWVSAPADGHSGASAMVSLRRKVEILDRGDRRFAVTGRPADSLLAALRLTMRDTPPDIVLSGVNHGLNVGGDLVYSGTVGVAVVAALNGIPAIALSAENDSGKPVSLETWEEVRQHVPAILERICQFGFAPKSAYGVNFPKQVKDSAPVITRQGPVGDTMFFKQVAGEVNSYILHHSGNEESLVEGTDSAVIAAGRIAITPITLDRTDHEVLRQAAKAL